MNRSCFCLLSVFGLPVASLAATLTLVPMQGSMVMPMLAYRASDGTLTVQLEPTVPELVPLMVSNPGDNFDPADPWYEALDPSRQGLAFSRRYGFVMSTMTDPLPAGTAIWIRKQSSSPGLEVYRYRSSTPKVWEPIFGTRGTTNALEWNGTMFHPAFTALPGSGPHTATFEAFLLETATGHPVPGSNTGPFIFNWTVASDGRPMLNLALKLAVSWNVSATNYVLESAASPLSTDWAVVTNSPVQVDGQTSVLLEPAAAAKFYRLRQVP